MKTLATLVLIAAALLATHLVTAAGQSDRPGLVAEADWIPLSKQLGFVLSPTPPVPAGNQSRQLLIAPESLPAELMPPLKGYFVVKTAAGWRRLAVDDPLELSRLELRGR